MGYGRLDVKKFPRSPFPVVYNLFLPPATGSELDPSDPGTTDCS